MAQPRRKPALALVESPPDPETLLLAAVDRRETLRRELAELDAEIAEGCRAWSFSRGYRVPLRPEQIRRAIEAARQQETGAG